VAGVWLALVGGEHDTSEATRAALIDITGNFEHQGNFTPENLRRTSEGGIVKFIQGLVATDAGK